VRGSHASVPAVAVVAFLAWGCATHAPEGLGHQVTLVPREPGAPRLKGELLAVDHGRILVRTKDGVSEVDPSSLQEVRVRRHNLTGGWAKRWGLVGGLGSGIVLAASCSSVEGNSGAGCAAFGAGVAALWAVVGLLVAPDLEASSQVSVDPESKRLKPYARLPAGLPDGVTPRSLVEGPPAPR
jgi:hypothetical protein